MLFYRVLASLALLAYSPYALLRSFAGRRRLGDVRGRLGRRPYPDLAGGIWIHAVSVGEVGVARNLLPALRRRLPGCAIGLSVTTAAGRELAERVLSQVPIFAFPFDLDGPVERALARVNPGLVIVTETELWPLFLRRASRQGIPVALVNGRISARSLAKYRLVRRWFARVLEGVVLFAMQSPEDATRIEALGGRPERIRVLGNIKYDLPPPPSFADAGRLRAAAAGRPVVVAGSTGEGEETLVLEACRRLLDRPFLILAPRRPERFDEVARLLERQGLRLLRRSTLDARLVTPDSPVDAYLLDSIGELASVYRETALAFVGGSLVPTGGHNPIEAWAAGVPTIAGPHMQNFREIAARGEALGILTRVRDVAGLSREIAAALERPGDSSRRGQMAARFVAASAGAADRTAEAVLALVPSLSGRRVSTP